MALFAFPRSVSKYNFVIRRDEACRVSQQVNCIKYCKSIVFTVETRFIASESASHGNQLIIIVAH